MQRTTNSTEKIKDQYWIVATLVEEGKRSEYAKMQSSFDGTVWGGDIQEFILLVFMPSVS